MKSIQENSVITAHLVIKLEDDTVADDTRQSGLPAQITLGDGSISPGFEQQLLGLAIGDKKSISLKAQEAFGMPNPDNIHHMERAKFSGDVQAEVGTIMAFSAPDGTDIPGIITEVTGESVTVDFNHPLAGRDVCFEVEIVSVE